MRDGIVTRTDKERILKILYKTRSEKRRLERYRYQIIELENKYKTEFDISCKKGFRDRHLMRLFNLSMGVNGALREIEGIEGVNGNGKNKKNN